MQLGPVSDVYKDACKLTILHSTCGRQLVSCVFNITVLHACMLRSRSACLVAACSRSHSTTGQMKRQWSAAKPLQPGRYAVLLLLYNPAHRRLGQTQRSLLLLPPQAWACHYSRVLVLGHNGLLLFC
jgi:hypothetical protein